jgi:hypothetical protein
MRASPVHHGHGTWRDFPAWLRHTEPTLLCCRGERRVVLEVVVEVAGEGALDAPACFLSGFPGGLELVVGGGGPGVVVDALERDHVQRPVELSVSAAVEPVASLSCAGGVDWAGGGESFRQRRQLVAERIARGHDQSAELVEGGGASSYSSSPLEQQQP